MADIETKVHVGESDVVAETDTTTPGKGAVKGVGMSHPDHN